MGASTHNDQSQLSEAKLALLRMRLGGSNQRAASAGTCIPKQSADARPVLSFSQQRIWFLDQLDPENPVYLVPLVYRFRGNLETDALAAAFRQLVTRHETLRNCFPLVDGEPSVRLLDPSAVEFRVRDESQPARTHDELESRIRSEVERSFNLETEAPIRGCLIRQTADEHDLVVVVHHIVFDGWSRGIFLEELASFYNANAHGSEPELSELEVQFGDFAAWQREYSEKNCESNHLAYWLDHLSGDLPVLELPVDHQRPAQPSFHGGVEHVRLEGDLAESLRGLSREEGATLFMTLLAAFKLLLTKYSGQADLIIGSTVAGRNQSQVESLIGFFASTLALRSDLGGDPTFRELLNRVRQTALSAFAHQEVPFELLVERLNPERSRSRNPIFQVMFTFENGAGKDLNFEGLEVDEIPFGTNTAKFDLTLGLVDDGQGIVGSFEYSADLFESATIARMASHWIHLLNQVVAKPDARLSEFDCLTPEERRRLIAQWNQTSTEPVAYAAVHRWFEAQVKRSPEAVAVRGSRAQLSFADLDRRANKIAHYLRRQGIGPESIVGVCMDRSPELMIGLLGAWKAGAAYLPLDPDYPEKHLAHAAIDSGTEIVLTQKRMIPYLPVLSVPVVPLDDPNQEWEHLPDSCPEVDVSPENLAYIIYTSGSAGRPKGSMIPHRGLLNYLSWCDRVYGIRKGFGAPVHSSIAFDLTITSLFPPLLAGQTVDLVPAKQGLDGLLDTLRASSQFSLVKITPAHLDLVRVQLNGDLNEDSTHSFVIGGESLPAEGVGELMQRMPNTRFFNEYGPTETIVGCCVYEIPRDRTLEGRVPIGKPIDNTRLYLLDRFMNPVPIGVPGELYIGGDCVGRGYVKRPELTASSFVPDPYSETPGARLYRSGDMVRLRLDGNFEFLRRLDDQVKIRGFRIEPEEIAVVLREHPAITHAVVVPKKSPSGDHRLVAYLRILDHEAVEFDAVRDYLEKRLPRHMVPASFVRIEEFPLTKNGKIDRSALPEDSNEGIARRENYVPPRDDTEIQLVRIWESVLGVKPIGTTDNFFDLGGHSLLAVKLFAEIGRTHSRHLPLATLFQVPTIAQLAKALREERWSPPWSAVVPIHPHGSNPPFFCVHGVGGNVLNYHGLGKWLGENQPLCGIQARGLNREEAPLTSVEEMASDYIREVLEYQPKGPYYLGGMSFGGTVAFEMARQLEERGLKVGLLALFDTGVDWIDDDPELLEWVEYRISNLARRVKYHADAILNARPADGLAHIKNKYSTLKRNLKTSRWQRRFHQVQKKGEALPRELYNVKEACWLAAEKFRPRPFGGRLTLFRASVRPIDDYGDPDMGWRQIAKGGVDVFDVPGDHLSMAEEPHVRTLAERLRQSLEMSYASDKQPAV